MIPVQAVLFDFGMVLSAPPDPAAWQRMKTITGLNEETLHREYWAPRHDYDRGVFTGQAYWMHLATKAGVTLTPDQVTALIAADLDLWTQLNIPMLEWARSLQRAGTRTGILSNIGDAMAEGICAKFDWIAAFDHCTWSHALKLAKPEPAIYRHAAEGLCTPPANILFIDDRAENVTAALAAGMQAIQYVDHGAFENDMQARGLAYLLHPTKAASTAHVAQQ